MPTKTESGLYDVSADSHELNLASMEVLNWAPALLTSSERLLLYSLIYSLRPTRYLEIGTAKGGSALIVAAAMDASNPDGRIVCLDLEPQVDAQHWRSIEHRASMVVGDSGKVLPKARELAGGPFDFVFIDADHSESAVFRDANRVLPFLAEGGYLLFHDGYYPGVVRATQNFALQHLGRISDFGHMTREITLDKGFPYCGFRLMQLKASRDNLLWNTWNHWRLCLRFALHKSPVAGLLRKARRALQNR